MSTGFNIVLPPGGVLLGIGCDLIEVERIHGVLTRHSDRFLHRVFTEEERAYCSTLKHPHKHYAARWAAKLRCAAWWPPCANTRDAATCNGCRAHE